VLTASTSALLCSIIDHLSAEFKMKDLGPLSFFLGVTVCHTASGFFLSQEWYTKDLLERAAMSNCHSVPTPVDTKPKLSSADAELALDPTQYRGIAGALQYLTFMRPDIPYAVQ
jgi:hypothetical protein